MGYDYSLGFLARHHDLVQKLVKIYHSGEMLVYEAESWEVLRARHQLILSVLANISRNMKDYADIKGKIRCWTGHTETGFRLYTGRPEHKITGRPPTTAHQSWDNIYVPIKNVSGMEYTHPNTLDSKDEFATFVGKVLALPEGYKKAKAKLPPASVGEGSVDYFQDVFGDYGWTAFIDGHTLILEKTHK